MLNGYPAQGFYGCCPDKNLLLRKLKIMFLSVAPANHGVKNGLDEPQGAVFDAEDLLAEFEADALQLKMEPKSRTGLSNVSNFFSSIYDLTYQERKARIVEILERLEYIAS